MPLSKYRVVEVMHRDVASVHATDAIQHLLSSIAAVAYGCFVVVDEQHHPLGILTDSDVIRLVLAEQVSGSRLRSITSSVEAILRHLDDLRRTGEDTVADWMTSPVETIDEQDTLQRVAEIFAENRLHSLPVVRGGKLVGLVRPIDLVEPILHVHNEARRDATVANATGPSGRADRNETTYESSAEVS